MIHYFNTYIPRSYDLSKLEKTKLARDWNFILKIIIPVMIFSLLMALPGLWFTVGTTIGAFTEPDHVGLAFGAIAGAIWTALWGSLAYKCIRNTTVEIRVRRAKVSREAINTDKDIRWLRLRDYFLQQADSDWTTVWKRIGSLLQYDSDLSRKCDDIIANYVEATEDVPGLHTVVEGSAKTELETDFAAAIKATAEKLVLALADHDDVVKKAQAEAAKAELDEQLAIEEANRFAAAQQQIIMGQKVTFAREKMRQVVQ